MAKKTSEVLLQEVVGQLRQLNRSSVRDQLREAEATKRAESLMVHEEVQEEQQSMIIDGAEDFQRRFLAGQAKTFTDRKTQRPGSKLFAQENLQRTADLDLGYSLDITNHLFALGEIATKQWRELEAIFINTQAMRHALESIVDEGIKKKGSLYVHDLSVQESIGEVLKFDESRANELDRQRNNDLRSQIENRREGGGGGMGMLGAGAAGGGGLGMEMIDAAEGGGFIGNAWKNLKKSPWLALALASPLLLFSKVRGMFGRAGAAIFAGFARFRGVFTNRRLLSNPMNWRKILVSGVVYSALAAWSLLFDDETQGPNSDTFDNADIDLSAAPTTGNWWSNSSTLDKAFMAWLGWDAVRLTSWGLKKTIGTTLGGLMRAAWGSVGRIGIGFWLMRALSSAGLIAAGVAGLATWPVWVAVLGAGVAWWQWDRITSFLAGEGSDEGIAQITDAGGLAKGIIDANNLKKFDFSESAFDGAGLMIKQQEDAVANLIASTRDNAEYRDQIIQTLVEGGWSKEKLFELGQIKSAVLGPNGELLPGTSEFVDLSRGQNRFMTDAYYEMIDEHFDKNQAEKKFNRFGIKTSLVNGLIPADGVLPLADSGGPMVLSPITDQKRINNSTNKVVNNHFHINRAIPFGQGEEFQLIGPWSYNT